MLAKLNKLAPYAALALLGYLTYTTLEERLPRVAQGQHSPTISKKLLNPVPVAGADRASPAGRDPFEVSWASYLKQPKKAAASAPASRPATQPVVSPAVPAPRGEQDKPAPPLPGDLVGVFASDGLTLAVIGDQIYKAGSVTGNGDPETNWVVQEVRNDSVVLRYGSQTAVLQMRSGSEAPKGRPTGRGGGR